MKEKQIKIFLYNLNNLFGSFEINEVTISLLQNFMIDSFNENNIPFLELLFDIKELEDPNECTISFEPYLFDKLNKEVQRTYDLRKIFDDVPLNTANMIGVVAIECYSYIYDMLNREFTDNGPGRYLTH